VLSLAALLVMVVVIAHQERLWQEHVKYRAVFRNVAGLKVNSEVRLAGVTAGEVTKMFIAPTGNIVVTFKVLKQYEDRIRQDSVVSITSIGLLGEKALDITAGSPHKPVIPPDSLVTSVEPLDLSDLLTKAGPSLENLQKILTNLASLTEGLTQPKGAFTQTIEEIRRIITKIDQGKGTLGLLVNDAALYQETTKSVVAAGKLMTDLTQSKGLMGTLLSDKAFKAKAEKTLAELEATFANLQQGSGDLKAALARLPEIAKKSETFLDSLNQAGVALPGLVSDADKVARAAQRSWLLRWYVTQPREHTIRLESNPGKD
jgi:phospholipid/cholesterol/gamma-HCH transport system substrate-binding protein